MGGLQSLEFNHNTLHVLRLLSHPLPSPSRKLRPGGRGAHVGRKGLGAVVYWDSEELCDVELALAPSASWISSLNPWGRCWGRATVGFLLDAITLSCRASLLHRSGATLWGCDEESMKECLVPLAQHLACSRCALNAALPVIIPHGVISDDSESVRNTRIHSHPPHPILGCLNPAFYPTTCIVG